MSEIDRSLPVAGVQGSLNVVAACEHLAEACAELVTPLLQCCPGVMVLATSREPLGVAGEMLWRLWPLDQAEGMRLFVDRACARYADFDAGDGTVVDQVCQSLDCLPLAIELAAARNGSTFDLRRHDVGCRSTLRLTIPETATMVRTLVQSDAAHANGRDQPGRSAVCVRVGAALHCSTCRVNISGGGGYR